jgi:hypothetical protein
MCNCVTPSDLTRTFCRWLGHFTMAMVTGHGVFYYWYWLADPDVK